MKQTSNTAGRRTETAEVLSGDFRTAEVKNYGTYKDARDILNDAIETAKQGDIEFAYWLRQTATERARWENYSFNAEEMSSLRNAFKEGREVATQALSVMHEHEYSQGNMRGEIQIADAFRKMNDLTTKILNEELPLAA